MNLSGFQKDLENFLSLSARLYCCVVDNAGIIEDCNHAFARIAGLDSAKKGSIKEFLLPEHENSFQHTLLSTTPSATICFSFPGHPVVNMRCWFLRSPDQVMIIAEDFTITDSEVLLKINQFQEELIGSNRNLKHSARELQKKNQELERLTNLFVAREFRIKELKDQILQLKKAAQSPPSPVNKDSAGNRP